MIAIDPGPVRSALVAYEPENEWAPSKLGRVVKHIIMDNDVLLFRLREDAPEWSMDRVAVIEQVVSYGRPVGADTFETVRWAGRFEQRLLDQRWSVDVMPRALVKRTLCGPGKATDAVLRQRLIDLWGRGGGKRAAVGLKAKPGPLYGVKADEWQALALAVAFHAAESGATLEGVT